MFLRSRHSAVLIKRLFTVKFSIEHEWVHYNEKTQIASVGITEFSQSQLGGVLHLSLPGVNFKYHKGDRMGTIESTKVVEDIIAPITGTVIEVNQLLLTHPEVINQSAESNGWIAKIKADDPNEISKLLDEESYKKLVAKIKAGRID